MLLVDLVAASHAVAATRSRTAKVAALADCLRRLGAGERPAGIAYLSGALPEGRIGIGYAALRDTEVPAAAAASLTLQQAAAGIAELAHAAGPGSRTRRGEVLERLLARATAAEQRFLRRLMVGELRQGALEGIMADALAAAAGVDAAAVRRALMVSGSLAAVGAAALDGGAAALRGFRLTLFRPLLPMLAGTAPDVDAALQRTGTASVETKYDGARVQVHRSGREVRVYTRNLREVSANLPDLVAAVAGLPVRSVILDGEVLALRADGRPQPFQVTMSRFGRGSARTGGATDPAAGTPDRSRTAARDAADARGEAATGVVQRGAHCEAAADTLNPAATGAAQRTGRAAVRGRAPADVRHAAAPAAGERTGADGTRGEGGTAAPGATGDRAGQQGGAMGARGQATAGVPRAATGAHGQRVEGVGSRDTASGDTRNAADAAARVMVAQAGGAGGSGGAAPAAEPEKAGQHAGAAGTRGQTPAEVPGAPADEAEKHAGGAVGLPLQPFFFDCLHLDGDDLIDRPLGERLAALDRACPAAVRVPRVITADPERAARHAAEVLAGGHEGVMIKALDSTYEAGRRGSGWIKVKPAHTLDLVVVAVEWGSGRRRGWLSNLHLAARDAERGGFAMVGKTFKGMTDDTLRWQTSRFLELETRRRGGVVYVRPEQVVEIAFDGIQSSARYDSGMALRFARVKRYRTDKPAAEADTVAAMRALHRRTGGGGSGGQRRAAAARPDDPRRRTGYHGEP